MMTKLIFWTSAAFMIYATVGYPLLLWLAQFAFGQTFCKSSNTPSVSLLISAYNEASVIGAKVRNSLDLNYPSDQLEIVVASDGSTDATAELVRQSIARGGNARVRFVEFPENRGKIAVLNDVVPGLRGDIVAFSDATTMLASDSLRKLVASFADARVGAVSGVYRVTSLDRAKLGKQEDFYWRYETFLKAQEGKIGALTGAHGALYAMRKFLYPFPPTSTINDDFVIPTSVLRRGFVIAYEPDAIAYEDAHENEGFGRRVRVMAGNFAQLREIKEMMLWPPKIVVVFCLLSHKGARLLFPMAMIAVAVSNAFLWRRQFYFWFLAGQALFYILALFGAAGWLKIRLLRLPFYFCLINASLFAWLYQVIMSSHSRTRTNKRPSVVWK